jgi:hypothetical protein
MRHQRDTRERDRALILVFQTSRLGRRLVPTNAPGAWKA